ncbi:MxaP protein [Methylomarinum sp. Ch1-1]|uniref:MxaP protein n=1 Tax=Methylomarinum roseum TaxID=3067653 RepID=A0AAU7NYW0_9GAMM|nr:MxaP protein [Methylomarinum sp. Ch1-1]MDP4521723.1 MxaP protein [Methylomarinum sp. Ch1-1]
MQQRMKQLLPKSGWKDLLTVYINWSGVGFVSVLVADRLDSLSGVAYAAHYTDAVNAAIGFNFWLLISSIGVLLYCLVLPPVYWLQANPHYDWISQRLRFFTYMFFLVAFDEGALMVGILLGTMLGVSGRADLIISKSFLFSANSVGILTAMILANSLLWWLGESIYNRQDKSYSGVVTWALSSPLKYRLPSYLLLTTAFVLVLINQQ